MRIIRINIHILNGMTCMIFFIPAYSAICCFKNTCVRSSNNDIFIVGVDNDLIDPFKIFILYCSIYLHPTHSPGGTFVHPTAVHHAKTAISFAGTCIQYIMIRRSHGESIGSQVRHCIGKMLPGCSSINCFPNSSAGRCSKPCIA
ncbi:hypothetical protein ES703_83859 [subsurface metagenome]